MPPHLPPALLLAAGLGVRLRPLTYCRAKPAIPVAGVPLIRRILTWLRTAGVGDIVLNLHHLPETITAQVGDGSDVDLVVRYSWEARILGTAGGARHALPLVGPRFLMVNGDTLTDVDLTGLVATHERSGARVTLAVTPHSSSGTAGRYGGVVTDPAGRVVGFAKAGQAGPSWHFVGVQVVEASVFAALEDGVPAATIGGVYDTLLARDPDAIRVHVAAGRFLDIGTPDDYVRTSEAVAEAEKPGAAFGANSSIHPTARLSRTMVWEAVTIDRNAELVDCIVTDGVRVPAGARFERAMLLARSVVPEETAGRRFGDVVAVPFAAAAAGGDARPLG